MSERSGSSEIGESVYIESKVIMTTVRFLAPFSLTFALFLVFHGADTPGGSFQGGAIAGATILMMAFAFGIDPTRHWIANTSLVVLTAGGVIAFAAVGLIPMAVGGAFLEHPSFDATFGIATKWGLEAVEVAGIAPIVSGAIVGLFFAIAAGFVPLQIGDRATDEVTGDD